MKVTSIKRVIIDSDGKPIKTIERPMGFQRGPQEPPRPRSVPFVTKRRPRDRSQPDFPSKH